MQDLAGRTAVVTGGASGIGRALADRFAAAGMKIVLADIEEPALGHAADEMKRAGHDVIGVRTDVSKGDDVDRLLQETLEAFGGVHLVCNNAGVGSGGPIASIDPATWEWVLGVNLWGAIHGIRVFLPHLLAQEEGHIVNTASTAGFMSMVGAAPYCASKQAVVATTECLYQELALSGSKVGVSLLAPGWVPNTRIREAERNRPGAGDRPPLTDEEQAQLAAAATATVVVPGKEPHEVAELVHDAVVENRFYVFTDDVFAQIIRTRHADIDAARNPDAADIVAGMLAATT